MTDDGGSPVVIGGIGGSGTRVFCRIARAAGYSMGANLNESEDAVELIAFADRWLGPYHDAWCAARPVDDLDAMRADLHARLLRHRGGGPDGGRWGLKQPRSIHFLPFLRDELPGLRFLHVVRDGRDVAFGRQAPTVLENAGDQLLGGAWREDPRPCALIDLWASANGRAADFGESEMGERYLRVRFEDLCRSPAEVVQQLASFLGAAPTHASELAAVAATVSPPRSLGQWRRADRALADAVEERGREALQRFGYPRGRGRARWARLRRSRRR